MSVKASKTAEATQTPVQAPTPAQEQKAKAKKKGDVMYIGPTITGVVRHSTVFKDGVLSEKVKEHIEQLPMMEKLFVSMDELPKAIVEVRKKQSALGTIYAQTANKFI